MESPELERSTGKKPCALEKSLMEIQVQLEKVSHQGNNFLGVKRIFLVWIKCIFVIIGIMMEQA